MGCHNPRFMIWNLSPTNSAWFDTMEKNINWSWAWLVCKPWLMLNVNLPLIPWMSTNKWFRWGWTHWTVPVVPAAPWSRHPAPTNKIGSSRNLRFVFLSRCSISPVHNSCRFHRLATIWFIFLPGQAIEGWAKTQIYGREKKSLERGSGRGWLLSLDHQAGAVSGQPHGARCCDAARSRVSQVTWRGYHWSFHHGMITTTIISSSSFSLFYDALSLISEV